MLKAIHPHIAENTSVIVNPLRNDKKIEEMQRGMRHINERGKPIEMG
jgi:hypothetical protein